MPKLKVPYQHVVVICHGSDCKKKGASALLKQTKSSLKTVNANKDTMIVRSHCTGMCKKAPVVCLQPANIWLTQAKPKTLKEQIRQQFQS